MQLANINLRDILDLVSITSSCNDLPKMYQNVLTKMLTLFNSERANFLIVDNASGDLDLNNTFSIGLDQKYAHLFSDYYYKFDPFYAARNSGKIVLTVKDFMQYQKWINLDYYRKFQKIQNIFHQMSIHLVFERKFIGVLALFRSERLSDFSDEEIRIANILAPYLAASIEKIKSMAQMSSELNLYRIEHKFSSIGTVILDGRFQKLYSNEKAEQLYLSEGNKQNTSPQIDKKETNSIFSKIKCECVSLRSIMQDDTNEENPKQDKTYYPIETIYKKQDNNFKISIFAQNNFPMSLGTATYLISIEDINKSSNNEMLILEEKYGLTKREIEIFLLVSKGLTNKEISQKLFISQFTVKNHLKNIYTKIGIKRRTKLVASKI